MPTTLLSQAFGRHLGMPAVVFSNGIVHSPLSSFLLRSGRWFQEEEKEEERHLITQSALLARLRLVLLLSMSLCVP